ncbi:hypothetical protein BH09BAC3_BH09BAC3_35480 [soil metagenome]
MDLRENEKRNKTIGFITSLGIHSAVLLALIFLTGWKEPYPAPGASYGIELNFGLDDQGSGEVQPQTPVGTDEEQAALTETFPEQKSEDAKPEVKEEPKKEKTAEQLTSNDTESPALVKEEVKKETKKEPVKEVVKEKATETPKVIAAYKKEEKKEVVAGGQKGSAGNQGDDKDKVGDKGNPEGKLDAKALYGTPGGGGNGGNGNGGGGNGFGLAMGGWKWTIDPKVPDLPDNENGKIIFEIECDENGDITDIKTIERTLSASVERMLKEEILKNSLIRTAGEKAPARSRGRITFILKTK